MKKEVNRWLSLMLAFVMVVGMLPLSGNAATETEYHTVTCVTPGVKLYEYTWYNDTIGEDMTTFEIENSGFSETFIVVLERGYRESEDGLVVKYESSDQPLIEASRYDHDRTYYQVCGKYSTYGGGSYSGILSDTTIYVTGVEEDPDGDHLYGIWVDQGDGTHKMSCQDEGCDHCIIRDHIWDEGYTVSQPDCDSEGEILYRCTARDCQGEKRVAIPVVHNLSPVAAVEESCGNAGTVAHYFCEDCKNGFADADGTQPMTFADTCIAPLAHTESCGHTPETARFVYSADYTNSSTDEGIRGILLGKVGDKLYAMGNMTNADGSRNAVEVSVNEYGTVTATSDQAEFLVFSTENDLWGMRADGGNLAVNDGKIVVYDPARFQRNSFVPKPVDFYAWGENGWGTMASYNYSIKADLYINFDAENLRFVASDERADNTILYRELCAHSSMEHVPAKNPTCTEQGVEEYWYCEDCWCYYQNGNLEVPVEVEYYDPVFEWTKMALGHQYDSQGICENCGMKRPVYTQVSTLEQFDALSKDAYYLFVVKDGDKTYAATLPPENPYAWVDENENNISDQLEIDENGDGIPDVIADCDFDEDGILDYLQDQSGDDVVDDWDWELLRGNLEMDFYMMEVPNYVEVTMAADGTITITDEGAMELQMMAAGILGGGPVDEDLFEYEGILDTERIRAAWIPNAWVASNGMMGYTENGDHFMVAGRVYGDDQYPGIIDNKNWKISFNADGTACLVCTWSSYEETGGLQFVKYTDAEGNPGMTFFDCPDYLWGDSVIATNMTESLPVYLFASEAEYAHTHEWSDWYDLENGQHQRKCTVDNCPVTQEENHGWSDWADVDGRVHRRECSTCGTHEESAHKLDTWVNVDDNTHSSTCEDCGYTVTENHVFEDYAADNNGTTHTAECICGETDTQDHNFGEWVEQDNQCYKRQCAECAAEEVLSIPEDEPVNTSPDTNAAGTDLTTSDIELIDNVLTEEEQSAAAAGAEVSIYLIVEDISNSVFDEDETAVTAAAAADGDNQIGMYLDIDLFKKIDDDETQVEETNGLLTITIVIPEELLTEDDSVIRTYKIVRVHDGEAEVIEGTFDPESKTFAFQTDKFSTYALIYEDVDVPTFPDVPEGTWYSDAVRWAVKNNITTGRGNGNFAPSEACTRAHVVTFLWRAAGSPEPQSMNHNFTDVEAGSYYEKAVIWAVENGITAGKGSSTTFQPDTTCTRAEVVTFLWRAEGQPEPQSNENTFPDVPAGSYYEKAVLWAVENGITTGKGNGNFAPTEPCTRAHVVTFLYRAFED